MFLIVEGRICLQGWPLTPCAKKCRSKVHQNVSELENIKIEKKTAHCSVNSNDNKFKIISLNRALLLIENFVICIISEMFSNI